MRLLCVLFALTVCSRAAAAEPEQRGSDDAPATLADHLSLHGYHHGFYVGPAFGVTTIQGRLAGTSGAQAAWVIDRTFGIGLAGCSLSPWAGADLDDSVDGVSRELQGGHGGIVFEYILESDALAHGAFDLQLGAGGACIEDSDSGRCRSGRAFFVAEPTAHVDFNLLSIMRAGIGGGYRFAAGPDRGGLASSDIGGWVLRTTVKFGKF